MDSFHLNAGGPPHKRGNRTTIFIRILVTTSLYFLTTSLPVCAGIGPLQQKTVINIKQEANGSTTFTILSERPREPQVYVSNSLVLFVICIFLGQILDKQLKQVNEIKEGSAANYKRWRRMLTIIAALEMPVFIHELIRILLHLFN